MSIVGPGLVLRSWVVQTPLSSGSRSYCALFRFVESSSLPPVQSLCFDYGEQASWELPTLMEMEICVRLSYYLGELPMKGRVVGMGSLGRGSFRLIDAVQSWAGEMGCLAVIAGHDLVQKVLAGTRYWQLGFLGAAAYIYSVGFGLR